MTITPKRIRTVRSKLDLEQAKVTLEKLRAERRAVLAMTLHMPHPEFMYQHLLGNSFADPQHVARRVVDCNIATFAEARGNARRAFDTEEAARCYIAIVMRANDDIEIVRFNRNGSVKTLWNYTTGKKGSRVI